MSDTELIEHKEESVVDAAVITDDAQQSTTLSSLHEQQLVRLEQLDDLGDFKRYAMTRAEFDDEALKAWSDSERERLQVLDARHTNDPLARRMCAVAMIMLVMIAVRLWLM